MDFIAEYSSDDSSTDSEPVPAAKSAKFTPIDPEDCLQTNRQDPAETKLIETFARKTSNYSDPPPEQPFILSYSQEYSMNAKKQISAFFYLPWNPSTQVKKQLSSLGSFALKRLRKDVADFDERFICNSSVNQKIVEHGQFALSNKKAMTSLHVSLFPNASLSPHKFKQLSDSIQRAVKLVQIPPEILHKSEASPLDMMLSGGKQTKKNSLRFQLDNKLHLYKSTKSGSLFIGMGISKFNNKELTQLSSQYNYLASVSRAIEDQASAMNIPFNWSQFNVPQRDNRGDISTMYYHLSLVVCELTPRGRRMNEPEYLETKKKLAEMDMTQVMRNVHFEVDHMIISSPDKSSRISLV